MISPHRPDRDDADPIVNSVAILTFGLGSALFPAIPNLVTPAAAVFVLALGAATVRRAGWSGLQPEDPVLTALLVAFLAWATASILWSISPERSISRAINLLPIIFLVLVMLSRGAGDLLRASAPAIMWSILAGAGVSMVFMVVDILSGMDLSMAIAGGLYGGAERITADYNRGLSFVLGFCVVAIIWFKLNGYTFVAAALFGLALLSVALSESHAAKLATILAIIGIILASWKGRVGPFVLTTGFVIVALAQPFLWAYGAERLSVDIPFLPSGMAAEARIEIWDYVAVAVLERPWLGWGLDTTRLLPTFAERQPAFQVMDGISTHAHNNALELWSNLGIVGLMVGVAILGRTAWLVVATVCHTLQSMATGVMAWLFTISFVAYGLWQTTWLAAIVLTIAVFNAASLHEYSRGARQADKIAYGENLT
ncbi:O-antigen ligase family protein [Fodinicurvata sp. EGI_FJ10296]|uniref:O-antigen ligase family protein n=1 Tax=Fodinicurvata sp. EGI_FJ10296 TaxID=3231908 RepID=UPI003455B956